MCIKINQLCIIFLYWFIKKKYKLMATNSRLADLKRTFGMYRKNYFHDNAQIMNFLNSIDDIYNGSEFEKGFASIFSMNNGFFQIPSMHKFDTFVKNFHTVYAISVVIKDIVDRNQEQYKNLKKVDFVVNSGGTWISVVHNASSYIRTSGAPTNIQYMLNGSNIKIKLDNIMQSSQFIAENTKNNNITLDTNNMIGYGIESERNELLNYFYFLTRFQSFNMKSQLYAFHYFMDIASEFIEFFYKSQLLLTPNINNSATRSMICDYFTNNMSINLINKRTDIDNKINVNTTDEAVLATNNILISDKRYNVVKDNDNCGVTLNIIQALEDNIGAKLNNPDNFVCKIGETFFDILSIESIATDNNKYNIIIKLKAYTNQCSTKSHFPNDYRLFNHTGNQLSATILFKTLNDIRKQYVNSGKDLRQLNLNIMKSKSKINFIANKSKQQSDIISHVNTRLIVCSVIVAAVATVYAVSYFAGDPKIKTYGVLLSFVVAVLMNIVNMYFNSKLSIEEFENQATCASFTSNSSLSSRQQFVNNNSMIFMNYIFDLMMSYQAYISSLDTIDLFGKMSNSLTSEKKAFIEYDKMYKQRIANNSSSIDIMRHEALFRTGIINLMSSFLLLTTMTFLMHFIEPRFSRIYIYIFAILAVYIIIAYFFTVRKRVKTKSDNKYWFKISDSIANQL